MRFITEQATCLNFDRTRFRIRSPKLSASGLST